MTALVRFVASEFLSPILFSVINILSKRYMGMNLFRQLLDFVVARVRIIVTCDVNNRYFLENSKHERDEKA